MNAEEEDMRNAVLLISAFFDRLAYYRNGLASWNHAERLGLDEVVREFHHTLLRRFRITPLTARCLISRAVRSRGRLNGWQGQRRYLTRVDDSAWKRAWRFQSGRCWPFTSVQRTCRYRSVRISFHKEASGAARDIQAET